MDNAVFDGLTRLVAHGSSRRGFVGSLGALTAGGALGVLLGVTDVDARRKRKKKQKGKETPSSSPPPPPPSTSPPPPPPDPTCSDGVKNGSESDVDCGGPTCARCALGQRCSSAADCSTSRCDNNVCKVCVGAITCPTGCACSANIGACVKNTPIQAATCVDCPRYSFCTTISPTTVACYPPCA